MIRYSPKESTLYDTNGGMIKEISCPLEKRWEDLQRLEDERSEIQKLLGPEERHRFCDACQKKVFNLNGLNADEIKGACLASPGICVHATLPHPAISVEERDNDRSGVCPKFEVVGRRLIRTARRVVAMNEAVKNGFKLLIKPVIPDDEIGRKYIVWQDEEGYVQVSGDFRMTGPNAQYYRLNPYASPLPFAAYLLPSGLMKNESVYLADVIEDMVGGRWNQGDTWRMTSTYAVWNGEDFVIDSLPDDVCTIMG